MNTLLLKKTTSFDNEVVFYVYEQVTGFFTVPKIEHLIDHYDVVAKEKVNTIRQKLSLCDEHPESNYLWEDISRLEKEVHVNLDELAKMKLMLNTDELMDILNEHHVFFKDNYNLFYNVPLKEVW